MTAKSEYKIAAVLGAGSVGSSWAALFALRGLSVRIWDPCATSRQLLERILKASRPCPIAATHCREAVLNGLDVPFDAHRTSSFLSSGASWPGTFSQTRRQVAVA